ncbi:MAG TPA: excinuclease ABC subunit UvrC [Parachlamydiaceae bacterium]|nr:excinuclease ABC subunit UvrC [Parachlamydiaceae bacterium]
MFFEISKLDLFPLSPGVYLMKNAKGEILYIGKAKNIRQRVRQYFALADEREMIPYLINQVVDIETLVVFSEKEALLLENNLIKQHRPKYNALLKDDKSYIALKVTNQSKWPQVQIVRYRGKPKADGLYFGPYTSAYAARETLDLIQKIFPLRQCSDQEFARRTRPCILHGMKRCIAPCVNLCTKKEYDGLVAGVIKFLKGQDREVLADLYKEMEKQAEDLKFERAGELLLIIRQIEKTLEGQTVDKPLGLDMDALAICRQGDEVMLSKLLFRSGKLMGQELFNFEKIADDDKGLLESFLLQHYAEKEELPHEILLPVALESEALSEILSTGKKRKVYVLTPQKGEKKSLLEMSKMNAEAAFKKEKDAKIIRENTLAEMRERFSLKRFPERIECFDNSHIAGAFQVSSLVVFIDGLKSSKNYRMYKTKAAALGDDYSAMQETLTRRFKRAKEEDGVMPDLLIIDGGKGHLNIALKVLQELDVVTVDVIGVAKEKGRHDKGMTEEQVFLPGVKDPILLKNNSKVLFLLQQIRDEAHRFALSFHKKLRSKSLVKSELDALEGIGPKKKMLLLRHFGSVKRLRQATREELELVKGLSKSNIEVLLLFIEKNL